MRTAASSTRQSRSSYHPPSAAPEHPCVQRRADERVLDRQEEKEHRQGERKPADQLRVRQRDEHDADRKRLGAENRLIDDRQCNGAFHVVCRSDWCCAGPRAGLWDERSGLAGVRAVLVPRRCFSSARKELLAAPVDDLLAASGDLHVAVLVHEGWQSSERDCRDVAFSGMVAATWSEVGQIRPSNSRPHNGRSRPQLRTRRCSAASWRTVPEAVFQICLVSLLGTGAFRVAECDRHAPRRFRTRQSTGL